jgi:glucan phosphoethanolaminetransferase (alkaline phosphatase superfamily)
MTAPRFPKAWLVYAAVLTAAVVIGEVSGFLRGEPFSWQTLLNWIVTLALLTATWGYAMQRPVGNEPYWRRAFWILVVVTALMLLRVALASPAALVPVAAFMAFLVPAYVAAWRYAYRSAQLWNPAGR